MDEITLGDTLRFTRMRLKISHEELAQRSNIRMDYIKALEQEDFSALPERPLVRGYIQNLALELGLDVLALERQLDAIWKPQELRYQVWKEPEAGFLWNLAPVFPVVIFLALSGWLVFSALHAFSGSPTDTKDPVQQSNVVAQTVPLSIISNPSGAYVYLDRGFLGLTPIRNFPITQRLKAQLRLVKAGFTPYQDTLELIQGHALEVTLQALPKPEPKTPDSNKPDSSKPDSSKPDSSKPDSSKPVRP
jgi:cytoskeleton protein RodZ